MNRTLTVISNLAFNPLLLFLPRSETGRGGGKEDDWMALPPSILPPFWLRLTGGGQLRLPGPPDYRSGLEQRLNLSAINRGEER